MIARRISFLAAAVLALACWQGAALAEPVRIQIPDDSKFVVYVDLAAVKSSTVGSRILARAKEKLLADMQDDGLDLEKVKEIVGFDPFEEIQGFAVAASDYKGPMEKSILGCVRLRSTTGNLEGLLLSLPEYQSEEDGNRQIHSARPGNDEQTFCAFHENGDGSHTVVAATQRDALIAMLDSLEGEDDDATLVVTLSAEGGPLVALDVFELPPDLVEAKGPQGNVAKIVRGASIQITEADDAVSISASLVAATEKQAEQLEQAARGLGAMVSLAAANDPDDEDLQMAQRLASDLQVARDGATVNLKLSLPADQAMAFIEENVLD